MARFDVEEFVDTRTMGRTHISVLLVSILVTFVDGFDIFMIGKIAPAIAAGFGQPVEAMTLVIVLQQIGLAVGAFFFAPLADKFGRKAILVYACLAFGAFTLASLLAGSLTAFAIMRGLAGIFLAAGLPIVLALISEITPKHRRGTFIAIAMAGYSTGSAASGAVAAWLIDDYGWQSGFWLGGILPLLCVPLLLALPESPKYLVARNPTDPRIARTIRRIDPAVRLAGDESFSLGPTDVPQEKAKLTDVFSDGRGAMTAIIWLCCFLSMGSIALLGAWLPSFFQEMASVPIQRFAIVAMLAYGGGVFGTLTIGYLLDRIRATRLIPIYYIGLAATLAAMGFVPFGTTLFLPLLVLWSFFQAGGQAGMNTLITASYPSRIRGTALGWSGGAGRVGGMILPVFGGFAIAQSFSLQVTLSVIAIPSLAIAVLVGMLGLASSVRGSNRRVPEQHPA